MNVPLRRLGLGIAVALACTSAPAVAQRSAADVLKEIEERKDRSSPSLFTLLAQRRDFEGFQALKKAVDALSRPRLLDRAYEAFALYRDEADLESKALRFLVSETGQSKHVRQRGAAHGLAYFGQPAHDACERLARTHRDADVRAIVLKPIVADLKARGTTEALRLILDNFRIPLSGSRTVAMEAYRAFTDSAAMREFAERVKDAKYPRLTKIAIVEAVSVNPGNDVDDFLRDAMMARDPGVQFTALVAVRTRGETRHVAQIEKLTRSKDDAVRRAALVALARVRGADLDWQEEALDLAGKKDPIQRQAAAVALGELRTMEAIEVLYTLLRDTDYAVRVEALQQVGNLRRKDSVLALIDRLNGENGRLRLDVATVLRLVTGEDHGMSPDRWRAWWRAEGEAFQIPEYAVAERAERRRRGKKARDSTQVSFYGLEIVSTRVCFILDVSGSMQGGRIGAAKRELARSLEGYPVGDLFNIVFFSSDVFPWQDELLPMNERTRAASLDFVDRQRAEGATALFDAVEAAFEDPRVDTIYLLSDGQPTAGTIVDPGQIRAEVGRWNSARRIQINCIALGEDQQLLRWLASDSGGEYRQVR